MPLTPRLPLLLLVASQLLGCGDHYEGGGRRQELPTRAATDDSPGVGVGDGKSGAAPSDEDAAGAAGVTSHGGRFGE